MEEVLHCSSCRDYLPSNDMIKKDLDVDSCGIFEIGFTILTFTCTY